MMGFLSDQWAEALMETDNSFVLPMIDVLPYLLACITILFQFNLSSAVKFYNQLKRLKESLRVANSNLESSELHTELAL